jgi:hypothetical protein
MTEEIKFRNAPRTKETEARILLIREKCNKSFGSSYSRHECILVEFGEGIHDLRGSNQSEHTLPGHIFSG